MKIFLRRTDTKALSQFISNALAGGNIVLKSEGKQYFSYLHVADAVSGILTVKLKGVCGEAYNLADERSDITLCNLASLIAKFCGMKVVFDLPKGSEVVGFSPVMVARMDASKVNSLGWRATIGIEEGIASTLLTMKSSLESI